MRCGERRKVTGFLGPEIEDIKEKSRHQIALMAAIKAI